MKKLVFAAQVFGVIAMFPIIMFLELNRSNVNSVETNSRLMIKQHVEVKSICLHKNKIAKLKKYVYPAIMETILVHSLKYKKPCL